MAKRDFVLEMDAAKTRAQVARNRGQATGKAAAGWVRSRPHHTPAKGSWDRLLADTRARWHHVTGAALADYQWSVNPSRADIESHLDRNGGWL